MGKSLAIVGAGTMGRGITQVFLQVGFKVVLLDIDVGILEMKVIQLLFRLVKLIKLKIEGKRK